MRPYVWGFWVGGGTEAGRVLTPCVGGLLAVPGRVLAPTGGGTVAGRVLTPWVGGGVGALGTSHVPALHSRP